MKQEKDFSATSGYLALFLVIIFMIGSLLALIFLPAIQIKIAAAIIIVISGFCSAGFVIVNPNESSVLVLFGAYK